MTTLDAQPSAEDVRNQLGRLLASEMFAKSDRMSRFLRYVVERTLAGEADRLKEYAIGVDVFDRDDQYDPRVDSIVRVEAARLRSKVDEYYSRAGADDTVIIRLRRGSYVPAFEWRPAAGVAEAPAVGLSATNPTRKAGRALTFVLLAAASIVVAALAWRAGPWTRTSDAASRVGIAVLPFGQFSNTKTDELLAARVTDGITTELARLGTLNVVSATSARQVASVRRPLREIAQELNANLLVEGSIEASGEGLHVSVRVVDGATDRKIWVEDFDGSTADVPALSRNVAQVVAAAVAARQH